MKKNLKFLCLTVMFMFLGLFTVNAQSTYWENYFGKPFGVTGGCSGSSYAPGLTTWENHSFEHIERVGGCGSYDSGLIFYPATYSDGSIFINVSDVKVKSTDSDIITAEVKTYDFKKEKEGYESFVKFFNDLTLDEFYEKAAIDYGEENVKTKYPTKPTWWEYYNDIVYDRKYTSEPQTWWEAYGFESDPSNSSVEVLYYAHDLGKGNVTLSASGKEDIVIDWTIFAYEFNNEHVPNSDGLADILKNYDKYKDLITIQNDWNENETKYNFIYYLDGQSNDLSEIINNLKGKDVTVKFEQYDDGIEDTYYLNGMDIKSTVDKGFTYDHKISMETSINKEKIDDLMDYKDAIYIDFTYHGALPTTYNLNVDISQYIFNKYYDIYYDELNCKSYLKGDIDDYDSWDAWYAENEEYENCTDKASEKTNEQTANYYEKTEFTLLYYNPDTNKMEVVKDGLKANENGELQLEFEHFSSYVIVEKGTYNAHNTPKPKAPNNADTSSINIAFYGLLALVSVLGVSTILIISKKNRKIV